MTALTFVNTKKTIATNSASCGLKTQMIFHGSHSNQTILANGHCNIKGITQGPEWYGLHLEVGEGVGWNGDDLMVDGHMVGMNLDSDALHFERRENESVWIPVTLPPGALWIIPEGQIWSVRHDKKTHFASAVISGKVLDLVLGRHYELRASYGIVDPVLGHLIRALVEQLHEPFSNHRVSVTESIVRNFMLVLGIKYGNPAAEISLRGGIAPSQLKDLMLWIKENIGSNIKVESMAAQVGLSVAHFAREFKRSTGYTPWEMVVTMRLAHAKTLLAEGETAHSAAQLCGFFDQAHMSRLFKNKFGISPSLWTIAVRTQIAAEQNN